MPALNTQISESTHIFLTRLVENLGYTKRLIVEIAIREFYQSESQLGKEQNTMSGPNLFDLFVGHGVTTEEVAAMDVATIAAQVGEMQADDPVNVAMTDMEIAQSIHDYASSGG